jgi:hypothetical protein
MSEPRFRVLVTDDIDPEGVAILRSHPKGDERDAGRQAYQHKIDPDEQPPGGIEQGSKLRAHRGSPSGGEYWP